MASAKTKKPSTARTAPPILVRVNSTERQLFEEAAIKDMNTPLSTWLRRAALAYLQPKPGK